MVFERLARDASLITSGFMILSSDIMLPCQFVATPSDRTATTANLLTTHLCHIYSSSRASRASRSLRSAFAGTRSWLTASSSHTNSGLCPSGPRMVSEASSIGTLSIYRRFLTCLNAVPTGFMMTLEGLLSTDKTKTCMRMYKQHAATVNR